LPKTDLLGHLQGESIHDELGRRLVGRCALNYANE
jgi:hypothetical protein